MSYDYEATMERRYAAAERREDRAYDRLTRQMNAADALIGELIREGRTVYYINVLNRDGQMIGRTREFSHRVDASDYLIRNRYV